MSSIKVGIVGARGHVGAELIRLIAAHPRLDLGFVSSRELAGQRVAKMVGGFQGDLCYAGIEPDALARHGADAIVLALPNGKAETCMAAIDAGAPNTVVVDVSADHRFDPNWQYGLPELMPDRDVCSARISNPGCYATAMQLAIAPMRKLLVGPAQCFGVSGYSGAGSNPSDRNDPDKLRDNLMPYALTGHLHEREVCRHLDHPVEFMPHVAAHFRGLMVTANLHLGASCTIDDVREIYRSRYLDEPLIDVVDTEPWLSAMVGRHGAQVGGFALSADGRRLVAVCVLDNLLKGAATQALQNLNRAFGLPELSGIPL